MERRVCHTVYKGLIICICSVGPYQVASAACGQGISQRTEAMVCLRLAMASIWSTTVRHHIACGVTPRTVKLHTCHGSNGKQTANVRSLVDRGIDKKTGAPFPCPSVWHIKG